MVCSTESTLSGLFPGLLLPSFCRLLLVKDNMQDRLSVLQMSNSGPAEQQALPARPSVESFTELYSFFSSVLELMRSLEGLVK